MTPVRACQNVGEISASKYLPSRWIKQIGSSGCSTGGREEENVEGFREDGVESLLQDIKHCITV